MLVGFTIIIPILLLVVDIELNLNVVPLFILLYILFRFLNSNAHKLYLKKEDKEIEKKIDKKKTKIKNIKLKLIFYIIILMLTGAMLYIIGEILGNILENLCGIFEVPEVIIGILLGIITSIPELITFFESQKHHKKKENDMLGVIEATNNLLTSNIVNLFIIQALAILIA
ncbi:MAG: hypothetical protein IJ223_06450 [Clostridia bacterium]|nr:hypothetical protein [Clostridia bacterium]